MDLEQIRNINEAIKKNEVEKVRSLLESNRDIVNEEMAFGTFLHFASMFGKYDIVKLLVENGADVNKKGGSSDCNPLTLAAFEGYLNIVEFLYEKGAILDTSTFPRNPLFAAISENHYDIAKFLVDKGIDTKASYAIGDLDNCDAYEYARQYGCTEIAEYLQEIL